MAKVTPDADAIVSEIPLAVRPERVFQALIDPEQVVQWWGAGRRLWLHEVPRGPAHRREMVQCRRGCGNSRSVVGMWKSIHHGCWSACGSQAGRVR